MSVHHWHCDFLRTGGPCRPSVASTITRQVSSQVTNPTGSFHPLFDTCQSRVHSLGLESARTGFRPSASFPLPLFHPKLFGQKKLVLGTTNRFVIIIIIIKKTKHKKKVQYDFSSSPSENSTFSFISLVLLLLLTVLLSRIVGW